MTTTPPAAAGESFDDLPLDALAIVAGFLLDAELFRLSHVTSYTLRALSSDALWGQREGMTAESSSSSKEGPRWFALMRDPKRSVSLKEDAMRHRSLLFLGNRLEDVDGDQEEDVISQVPSEHHAFAFSNAAFQRPQSLQEAKQQHEHRQRVQRHSHHPHQRQRRNSQSSCWSSAFSVELWFAVDSATDKIGQLSTRQSGGVLFGAQSKPFNTPAMSFFYQQFVLIDPSLKLFCSLRKSEDKLPLARLQADRWYHLVLVNDAEREIVYLDGRVVSVIEGPLSAFFWSQFAYCQVGTGLVRYRWEDNSTRGTEDRGARNRISWYNFHGVVDTFRAYDHALSKARVQELVAQGSKQPEGPCAVACKEVEEAETRPVFSMRQELMKPSLLRGEAATPKHCFVRCTRPQDGKFERL